MDLENLSWQEGLKILAKKHEGKIVFSSSFGQEDQVILHEIWTNNLPIDIFTLDTGRLFPETYELMDRIKNKYSKTFRIYFPESEAVESYVEKNGFNAFYESVELRKTCCGIRKITGLKRALQGAEVWITGLRAEQSENRGDMKAWEFDEGYNVHKYNPLINLSILEVEEYLEKNNVPQNILHRKGFVSIGCQPCTRAIAEGEHARAGRWWWESSQKECGLHSTKN